VKKRLHVLTKPNDALAQDIIARERQRPDCDVETVDLSQGKPDYAALLEKIFAADSIAVW
jgi:hypothetical protein